MATGWARCQSRTPPPGCHPASGWPLPAPAARSPAPRQTTVPARQRYAAPTPGYRHWAQAQPPAPSVRPTPVPEWPAAHSAATARRPAMANRTGLRPAAPAACPAPSPTRCPGPTWPGFPAPRAQPHAGARQTGPGAGNARHTQPSAPARRCRPARASPTPGRRTRPSPRPRWRRAPAG
ncbi:hypothetical protein D9M71_594150 [compost metagenome]